MTLEPRLQAGVWVVDFSKPVYERLEHRSRNILRAHLYSLGAWNGDLKMQRRGGQFAIIQLVRVPFDGELSQSVQSARFPVVAPSERGG
jgi:hypothetical protein